MRQYPIREELDLGLGVRHVEHRYPGFVLDPLEERQDLLL